MAQGSKPYGNFIFDLEIEGVFVAQFMECSGLKTSSEVFEIEEGGLNGRTHKFPGRSKWENIVLKHATNASMHLLEWRDQFLQDAFTNRRSGSIMLKDNDGVILRRWSFRDAWPISWEGPTFNSGESALAIETLELAHEGLSVSSS